MCNFWKKPVVDPATIRPYMGEENALTGAEVRDYVRNLFPDAEFFVGDSWMWAARYDDIAVFLAQDMTNKAEYVTDEEGIPSHDCNVFANRLKGQFSIPYWCDLLLGKAWLWEPRHALNCVITEDFRFFWVEPQTDELLPVETYQKVQFIEF
jgi:hypothetical protein